MNLTELEQIGLKKLLSDIEEKVQALVNIGKKVSVSEEYEDIVDELQRRFEHLREVLT